MSNVQCRTPELFHWRNSSEILTISTPPRTHWTLEIGHWALDINPTVIEGNIYGDSITCLKISLRSEFECPMSNSPPVGRVGNVHRNTGMHIEDLKPNEIRL
jgi:hypothetical protein